MHCMNNCFIAEGFPKENFFIIKDTLFSPESALYLSDETISSAYFGKIINIVNKSFEIEIPFHCGFFSGCDDYLLITNKRIVLIQYQKKKKKITVFSFKDIDNLKIIRKVTSVMARIDQLHLFEKNDKKILEFQIKAEKDLYGVHFVIRSKMRDEGWKADISKNHKSMWMFANFDENTTAFINEIDRLIKENGEAGHNRQIMKDHAIKFLSLIHEELQYAELFDDNLTHSSKLLDGLLKSLQSANTGMFEMSALDLNMYLKQLDYEYSIILCKIGKELNSYNMALNPFKYGDEIGLVYRSTRPLANYLWEFPWISERLKIIEYGVKARKIERPGELPEWTSGEMLFKWQWNPPKQGIPTILPSHSFLSSSQGYLMKDKQSIFSESQRIDPDGYQFGQKFE